MHPVGIIAALSLSIGVLAQSCDVGGFSMDDFRDRIIVTNAASGHRASAFVKTDYGNFEFEIRPGGQAGVVTIAATDYSVQVEDADFGAAADYRASLVQLRDRLQEITLSPEASGAEVSSALTDLYLVQKALRQMTAGGQTCTGKIKTGVDNNVTINWTDATGTGVWVLSCG